MVSTFNTSVRLVFTAQKIVSPREVRNFKGERACVAYEHKERRALRSIRGIVPQSVIEEEQRTKIKVILVSTILLLILLLIMLEY